VLTCGELCAGAAVTADVGHVSKSEIVDCDCTVVDTVPGVEN
jgi:hypothetical protein